MEGVDVVGRAGRSVRQRRSGTADDEDRGGLGERRVDCLDESFKFLRRVAHRSFGRGSRSYREACSSGTAIAARPAVC
jgi:hypothetical protein